MQLSSPAFEEGGLIPMKFTCEGQNCNPELHITGVPRNAVSLVLIMDDPDVPEFVRKDRMYDHWVVFNIPPGVKVIEEGSVPEGEEGKNTSGAVGYTGPCPPDREHRYFFKLYALDCELELRRGATKKEVEKAMQGNIIAETRLMGRYDKKNR